MSQQPLSDKVIEQYGTGNMIFSASRNLTSHSELELPELVCKALALAYPISDNVALSPEVNTDVLAQLLLILCFAQEWIKESNSHEVREYQYCTVRDMDNTPQKFPKGSLVVIIVTRAAIRLSTNLCNVDECARVYTHIKAVIGCCSSILPVTLMLHSPWSAIYHNLERFYVSCSYPNCYKQCSIAVLAIN